jgi:hypothetical protein
VERGKMLRNETDATSIRKGNRKIFHKDGRSKERTSVSVPSVFNSPIEQRVLRKKFDRQRSREISKLGYCDHVRSLNRVTSILAVIPVTNYCTMCMQNNCELGKRHSKRGKQMERARRKHNGEV